MDSDNRAGSPISQGQREGEQKSDVLDPSGPLNQATQENMSTVLMETDEASRLRELQADVRDQGDLEKDISRQVLRVIWIWELTSSKTDPNRRIGYSWNKPMNETTDDWNEPVTRKSTDVAVPLAL